MPRLKRETIRTVTPIRCYLNTIDIYVSLNGDFYALLSTDYEFCIKSITKNYFLNGDGELRVSADTKYSLVGILKSIFNLYYTPKIETSNVILYNIESHISFVEENDKIFPNGYYCKDGKWCDMEKYGGHYSSSPAKGGYSLTIGAVAKKKIIYTYGTEDKVVYENYYGENGYHNGTTTPAEKLNSWVSFALSSNAKEIPYSDEAALFFYNLMYKIAELSKIIQDNTFDQKVLEKNIQSNLKLLG